MKHLKHMAVGAAVLLAGLLAFGVPLSTALQYAVVLSCPLMMIGMMLFMNHGNGHSCAGSHDGHSEDLPRPSITDPDATRHR